MKAALTNGSACGSDDWSDGSLADLCSLVSNQCDPAKAGHEIYVGLEHIDSGALTLSRHGSPKEVVSAKNRFKKNDILYGKLRPYLDKAVLAQHEGICSTDILVFRSCENVCPLFVLAHIHSIPFVEYAVQTTHGVNHPRTSWAALKDFQCSIPPSSEQQRIAAVLWKIQKAVEIEAAIVRNARDLKKSLLRRLFTHGLCGEPLKETEIGPLPESWQLVTIADVTTLLYRYPTYYNISYVSEGVAEVRGELLRDNGLINDDPKVLRFVSEETAARFPRVRLSRGDIVMSVRGTMGKIGIVGASLEGAVITANLIRLATNQSIIHSDFFRWALLSEGFQARLDAASSKTTIQTIPAPDLKRLQIPLPDISEQHEIADVLQTVDRKIDIHESKRRSLQDLFKTVLHKLMTAQIRVNDLDIDTGEVGG